MLLQILKLILWLILIPMAVGVLPMRKMPDAGKYRLLGFVSGYICLWAVFQVVAVPVILWNGEGFDLLVDLFAVISLALAAGGAAVTVLKLRKKRPALKLVYHKGMENKGRYVLWGIFLLLLAFQIYQMAMLAFADGDDAFYAAVSSVTEDSGTLYRKLPYTGGTTELDLRHALAPLPVWISFLSRMSGIHTAVLTHVAVPVVLLLLAYAIYGIIGQMLCREKKNQLPIYMILVSVSILFGNYSFKSAETFLITRTSQGKAVLGSIIFPFMILMLFIILGRLQDNKKPGYVPWALLAAGSAVCCLCSTMGGVLIAILLGVTGLFTGICYRKWNLLPGFAGCCLPALFYVILYLVLLRL